MVEALDRRVEGGARRERADVQFVETAPGRSRPAPVARRARRRRSGRRRGSGRARRRGCHRERRVGDGLVAVVEQEAVVGAGCERRARSTSRRRPPSSVGANARPRRRRPRAAFGAQTRSALSGRSSTLPTLPDGPTAVTARPGPWSASLSARSGYTPGVSTSLRERARLRQQHRSARPTSIRPARPRAPKKSKLKARLDDHAKRIAALQEQLWAEATAGGTRSVLLVLQGIDTAGKGGTCEHVDRRLRTRSACSTPRSRRRPTQEELRHDFLWRISKRVPAAGHDRRLRPLALRGRADRAGARPRRRARSGSRATTRSTPSSASSSRTATTVLKCFLHISYDTQRERLLAPARPPAQALEVQRGRHRRAQRCGRSTRRLRRRCSNAATRPDAPWYVVPADSKKYRNWAVAQLLRETLEPTRPAATRATSTARTCPDAALAQNWHAARPTAPTS